MKYSRGEAVADDGPGPRLAVFTGFGVDDDVNEEPDDLAPLLVAQTSVEPCTKLAEQRFDRGQGSRIGFEGRDPTLDVGARIRDPVELAIDLGGAETTPDVESDDPLTLLAESSDRPRQRD